MSTTQAIANPEAPALWQRRRFWIFPAGAGLGWAMALLAGTLLDGEIQPLRYLFIPLSALASGVVCQGAWMHFAGLADTAEDAVRRRRLRVLLTLLVVGATLLLGLYLRFAVPITYTVSTGPSSQSIVQTSTKNVAFLVGSSRTGLCECTTADDESCIEQMGLD
ncbi:MAG TPA: hypothetical protein VGK45_00680, partial [Thermoanaerobaculia bacterium]